MRVTHVTLCIAQDSGKQAPRNWTDESRDGVQKNDNTKEHIKLRRAREVSCIDLVRKLRTSMLNHVESMFVMFPTKSTGGPGCQMGRFKASAKFSLALPPLLMASRSTEGLRLDIVPAFGSWLDGDGGALLPEMLLSKVMGTVI